MQRRKYGVTIRGSGLLLLGRMISILINFGIQVLTVRYLTKGDYGAFSWAIAVVSMGSTFSLLSMQKAAARFLPIYIEKDDPPAQRGTILLAVGSTLTVGMVIIALTFAFRGLMQQSLVSDPKSVGLLLVLICLVPLQGLDSLLHSLFAVLASPRSIFFRRHILAPLLRLAAVLAVIATSGDVHALAVGYLIAGLLGLATYGLMLRRLLTRTHLFGREATAGIRVPAGEIYRFGLPLVTTDLLFFLKTAVVVIILESLWGTDSVAEFRAVVPLAGLNLLILQNVRILYLPLASRLHARDDIASIDQLYSKTSAWITVITFPVFATCVFLAEPVTTWLFGERYASAATILIVLAIGQYIDAMLGVNLATLNAFAKVRFIATANFVVATIAVALMFILIPSYGPLGAGIAASATIVLHNLINQVGLIRLTGVGRLQGKHLRVYGAVAGITALLIAVRSLTDAWVVMAISIALCSVGLLRWSRHALDISETFPELSRVPGMRFLLGERSRD